MVARKYEIYFECEHDNYSTREINFIFSEQPCDILFNL